MWHFRRLLLFCILAFVYFFVLLRGLNEGSRRSLQLRDDTDAADHIVISVPAVVEVAKSGVLTGAKAGLITKHYGLSDSTKLHRKSGEALLPRINAGAPTVNLDKFGCKGYG